MSEHPKGARKVALETLSDLIHLDASIEGACKRVWEAQMYLDRLVGKREELRFKLKDVIERCTSSLGSDDGK